MDAFELLEQLIAQQNVEGVRSVFLKMPTILLDYSENYDFGKRWPLLRAIKGGNYEIVELLLIYSQSRLPHHSLWDRNEDIDGRGPMHHAVMRGDFKLVQLLIDYNCSVGRIATSFEESPDKAGWQPLHFAASLGRVDIANLLIEYGAELAAETNSLKTIVEIAKDKGHDQFVVAMQPRLETAIRSLRRRAISGDVVGVQNALKKGEGVDEKGNALTTPLHEASYHGHIEVVKLLLDNGADPNHKDAWGRSVINAVLWDSKSYRQQRHTSHGRILELLHKNKFTYPGVPSKLNGITAKAGQPLSIEDLRLAETAYRLISTVAMTLGEARQHIGSIENVGLRAEMEKLMDSKC